MKYDKLRTSNSNIKAIFLTILPMHIFFIALSIYNILTKDSILALSLSIFSLMIFTSMLTLFLNTYMISKTKNNSRWDRVIK